MFQSMKNGVTAEDTAQDVRRRGTKRATKRFALSMTKKTMAILAAVMVVCLGFGVAVATNVEQDPFGPIGDKIVAPVGDQPATKAEGVNSDPLPDAGNDAKEADGAKDADKKADDPADKPAASDSEDKDAFKAITAGAEGPKLNATNDALGHAQKLVLEDIVAGVNFWQAEENGVKFPVYCFNSSLHWPSSADNSSSDQEYVPDSMMNLAEPVKNELYRIFYAGYPYNNAGLYRETGEEWVPSLSEIKEYATPPQFIKDAYPGIAWDSLDFSAENLLYSVEEKTVVLGTGGTYIERIYTGTPECDALEQVAADALEFDSPLMEKLFNEAPGFLGILMAHSMEGKAVSIEELQEVISAYASSPTEEYSGSEVRAATQYAVWILLNEEDVPNNTKTRQMFRESTTIPAKILDLAEVLVAFGKGVDPYADMHVPERGTTFEQMQAYQKDKFSAGQVLCRENGEAVGNTPIVFTQKDSGLYVSETLHFSNEAYTLPYQIALMDGSTSIASTVNHGSGAFQLVASEIPASSGAITVSVTAPNHFPSDVFQYVAASDSTKQDITTREYQEMSGVYFMNVDLGMSVGATFIPKGKTSVNVTKIWDDGNDQDGKRPDDVRVQLYRNDSAVDGQVLELTATSNWKGAFNNLDLADDNGTQYVYTVQELMPAGSDHIAGYLAPTYGTNADGLTVTNKRVPETMTVSGKKTWVDGGASSRPDKIVVRLHADLPIEMQVSQLEVTPDSNGNWTYKFENLPRYHAGEEVRYSISEDAVENYDTVVKGWDIENTYVPGKTSVFVNKIWDDADDQDGIRPDFVKVGLYKNGDYTGTYKILTLNEAMSWEGVFTDLDIADSATSSKNVWTVKELDIALGYAKEPTITGDQQVGYTITNKHEPSMISIEGKKTWDDADNQDGHRPKKITVFLEADGQIVDVKEVTENDGWAYKFTDLPEFENGKAIPYEIVEEHVEGYTTAMDGYNIINKRAPGKTSVSVVKSWRDHDDQDGKRPEKVEIQLYANGEAVSGKTLTLSADNRWEGIFGDLDEYKAGHKIAYTVKEVVPAGSTAIKDYDEPAVTGDMEYGFVVTNAHTPETTSVEVEKIWDDGGNQDGKRPSEVTVYLLKNGEIEQEKTISASGNWACSFDDLPKYEKGELINYEVAEKHVTDYSTHIDFVNGKYKVTNKCTPGKTSVEVVKSWLDHHNQDGLRPTEVKVQLYADGEAFGEPKKLNDDNHWTYVFEDLDEKKSGKSIVYTVKEVDVPEGYTDSVSGSADTAFVISNAHNVATTTIEGVKTWDDADNQDGKRPASITINLLADGEKVDSAVVTAAEDWKWNFGDLPVYANGVKIAYTITEEAVSGYSATIDGFNVKNSYTPGKTSVQVTKAWNDAGNQDGVRPSEVKVELLAGGKATGKTVTLNEANKWNATFTDLDEFAAGEKIAYAVKEVAVDKYTSAVTGNASEGFVVTNTHELDKTQVKVSKAWDDSDNKAGKRADKVVIKLLADGVDTGKSLTLNADNKWEGVFTDLNANKAGKAIAYTVVEEPVEGYEAKVTGSQAEGFTVTNTHKPINPNKPDNPDNGNGTGSGSSGSASTGDHLMIYPVIALLLGSIATLTYVFVQRRRERKAWLNSFKGRF